jgi:DNA invertase Pin-like site-specific DNA recombinase
MQLRELREYCAVRKWTIVDEYVDSGWSGTKRSRPDLERLRKDARSRKFDCVAVWKMDRFGRSLVNFVDDMQNFVSARESPPRDDTAGPRSSTA